MLTSLGGQVVGSTKHPLGTTDFSSYLVQAQSSGAKVVALADTGADLINVVKQAAEFGLTPRQMLAGLFAQIVDVDAIGLAAAHGLLLTEASTGTSTTTRARSPSASPRASTGGCRRRTRPACIPPCSPICTQ